MSDPIPLVGVALLTEKLELGSGPQAFVVAVANLSGQNVVVDLGLPSPHYGFSLEDNAGQVYWQWSGPALDNNGDPITQLEVLPRQYATLHHEVTDLQLDSSAPNELLLKGFLQSVNLPFRGELRVTR